MNGRTNYNILQSLCEANRWAQVGEFWFEDITNRTVFERIYQYVVFVAIYSLCGLEVTEIFRNTYPEELHGDALALGMCHCLIVLRTLCLRYNTKIAKKLNYEVALNVGMLKIENSNLLKKQFKKFMTTLISQASFVMLTSSAYLITGILRYYKYNMPFTVLPIIWPSYGDTSAIAVLIHLFYFLTLFLFMFSMISADTLAVAHLMIICFKFKNLRYYFENLYEDFDAKRLTTLQMKELCLNGVLEHRNLIRLTHDVRKCFGVMMSLQVIQGSSVLFLVFVKIALSKNMEIPALVLNIGFILGLLIQLGMYLWNAGEVTYQASLIPDAIFHCGWHLRSMNDQGGRDLRKIVLMGCVQSQQPLILKAFGIQTLSYEAFVSILKATYSVFAVLYP